MISGDVKRRQIKLSQSCSLLKAVLAQQHLKSLLDSLWDFEKVLQGPVSDRVRNVEAFLDLSLH